MSVESRASRWERLRRGLPRRATLVGAVAVLLACRDHAARDPAELTRTSDAVLADEMVTQGASARRVADYPLTRDNVERWFEADEALDALAEDDLEVARRLEDGSGGRGADDPIERAAAHLATVPGARETLDDVGLTPYEYVLTGLALHQALLASGPGSPPTLRRLAARNARFIERHVELLARYAERRPRYLATTEPESFDVTSDSLGWIDTAAAAGEVVLDSAVAVDTLMTVPPPLPPDSGVLAPTVPVAAPVTPPDSALPDSAVPDSAVPDSAVPDSAVPVPLPTPSVPPPSPTSPSSPPPGR